MARIRSIKPEFFTDAELCELSPLHRLMFAGLWCQADRDGRVEDKPRELKVKCLPYDNCDADALLGDLAARGFIIRYAVEGRRYLAIRHFTEHQRFHKDEKPRGLPPPPPEASTVPAPPLPPVATVPPPTEQPVSTGPKALVSDVRTSDVGHLESVDGHTEPPAAPVSVAPGLSPLALQALWNTEAHRALPRWQGMGKTRKAAANARIRENPDPAHWRSVIARINASPFCRGENRSGWRASPDWLVQPETADKVLEGKYDRAPGAGGGNGRASEADKDWSGFAALPESEEIFEEASL